MAYLAIFICGIDVEFIITRISCLYTIERYGYYGADLYSHVPHNDILVGGPHMRWWSHKFILV